MYNKYRVVICGLALYMLALQAAREQAASSTQEQLAFNYKGSAKKHRREKTIKFDFDTIDLVDIVNMLAAEKGVNVILPIGANVLNAKVVLHMTEQITLTQAWQLLYTLLNVAGYSMIEKNGAYTIVKNTAGITRDPAPIYIGIEPEKLPDFEKRITYIYYLSHIKVPLPGAEKQSELDGILKELLSQNTLVLYEQFSNAIIINDNANSIKSAMTVIKELDHPGFQESFDTIQLNYTQADAIADLFNKSILAATDPRTRFNIRRPGEAFYFPQGTRIIPEPRTNRLFVLGTRQAIDRVKDFIRKEMDVDLGSGKSIIHTYQLQYLDANTFAPVLESIVKSASAEGTGQAKTGAAGAAGPERYFEGVIITTDKPRKSGAPGSAEYFGSNHLIIAARNDDWKRIKKLIEQLDTPQATVIIEVLIVDLTMRDNRTLGNMMRNPKAIPLFKIGNSNGAVEFQSAQITPGEVATNLQTPALPPAQSSIAADLAKFNHYSGSSVVDVNMLAGLTPGSTAITISDKDGSVWDILQVLQSYGQTKILSHPHVVATNNKQATVSIGEDRIVDGDSVGSAGGAVTVKKDIVKANLEVKLTPLISEEGGTISLKVEVKINEFISSAATDANRVTRTMTTSAAVLSGDILPLGGLIRDRAAIAQSNTPLLERIPIIGWLFKRRNAENARNNLTVFIRPTMIQPRLRGGVSEYTEKYIALAHGYAKEGTLFDNMRDPITRWFFKTAEDTHESVDAFLQKTKVDEKIFDAPKAAVEQSQDTSRVSEKMAMPSKGKIAEHNQQMAEIRAQNQKITCSDSATVAHAQETQDKDSRADQLKKLLKDEMNPLLAQQQVAGEAILNA